jgi:uncharacterized membrane protein
VAAPFRGPNSSITAMFKMEPKYLTLIQAAAIILVLAIVIVVRQGQQESRLATQELVVR